MLPGWCCIAIAALELGNGDSWCHMCAFRFHFWGRKVNWNQASHVRASSISTRSLFRSYSPSKLSSSCRVVPQWAQFCRTAPSICNGQPTGMCDCSRSPSPFCSMIVPSIGTSIVTFKLICVRLQLHVSGASKPRLASSASAGNSGCSFRAMLPLWWPA